MSSYATRWLVGVLFLIASLLVPVSKVEAYSLLNLYINTHSPYIYLGTFDRSADEAAFKNGVSAWNAVSTPIRFYYTTGSNAIDAYGSNDGATGWDGFTTNFTNSTLCNGWNQEYHAEIQLNSYYTQNYPSGAIQSVAAHELGHAIGLSHGSGAVLMNPTTQSRWFTYGINTPQADDISGTNYIYTRC